MIVNSSIIDDLTKDQRYFLSWNVLKFYFPWNVGFLFSRNAFIPSF